MKKMLRVASALAMSITLSYSAEVLAVVNGKNITTEVAPKDFGQMEKQMQEQIVERLIQKRLASDYALSQPVAQTEGFKKALEHVLHMSSQKQNKDAVALADVLKDDASIKGYTTEQLYSKKGLLAFDFILDEQAIKLQPSEQELQEYYEATKFQYDTPQMIELLTIVVDSKKTAEKIVKRLQDAQDPLAEFSQQAKEHSLAPSKDNHGYFGKIAIEHLNETLKPKLENFKRGDYTQEAIKTEFGYQLYYVLNDIPEFKSTFASVKSRVEEAYLKEKVRSWAMEKVSELKKEAQIKILL